jgi:WD40 repeat protein
MATTAVVTAPIARILSFNGKDDDVLIVCGSQVMNMDGTCLVEHPQDDHVWGSVAAVSRDGSHLALCDGAKQLFLYKRQMGSSSIQFAPVGVPLQLAKTATALCFDEASADGTDKEGKTAALLVADKFGDVLRFGLEEGFKKWAMESKRNRSALSIHTRTKAPVIGVDEEAELAADSSVETDVDEAHHCTIIGHISMITDMALLRTSAGHRFVLTGDRDEKIRVTDSKTPERIVAFALGHREYVATLAVPSEAVDGFFSAGGDPFVLEWHCSGNDRVEVASKIDVPAAVREVRANAAGDRIVIVTEEEGAEKDESSIVSYTKSVDGTWTRTACVPIGKGTVVTAFELVHQDQTLVWGTFHEGQVRLYRCSFHALSDAAEPIDQLLEQLPKMPENKAAEFVATLSKAKLRKNLDRIDWNLKKRKRACKNGNDDELED